MARTSATRRPGRVEALVAVAALGAVLLATAADGSAPAPAAASAPAVSAVVAAVPPGTPRPATGPAPVALELPTLDVRAAVVPVTVRADGELAVPDDPRVLGWWEAGGRPADPQAAVVLDGHVDSASSGLGALFDLRTVVPGDPVVLTTADGVRRGYVVTDRASYPKAALPASAFTMPGRLVLITCGGAFDHATHQYADNVVVTARPAGAGEGAAG